MVLYANMMAFIILLVWKFNHCIEITTLFMVRIVVF